MRVVNFDQGTQPWLDWRMEGVGASEAACLYNGEQIEVEFIFDRNGKPGPSAIAVVEGSPYKTEHELWMVKTGRREEPDLSGNPHVRRGAAREPMIRELANDVYGEMAVPLLGEHDDMPYFRASFDGIFSNGITLELKSVSEAVFNRAKEEGPIPYYIPQVLQQMAVKGAEIGILFLYNEDQDDYLAYRFLASENKEVILDLMARVKNFWQKVVDDKAPKLDPERDVVDMSGNDAWGKAAVAWKEHKAQENDAKKIVDALAAQRKALEKELVSMLNEFNVGEGEDVRVSKFIKQGSIDYKKALGDLAPETCEEVLEGYRKKSSNGHRVTDKSG